MDDSGTVHATHRLANYRFSDLYVSSDPEVPVIATNLSGPDLAAATSAQAARPLPGPARADARRLYSALEHEWAAQRFRPEFTLTHDGVDYRCSRIAAPGAAGGSDAPDNTEVWCLRRIEAGLPGLADLGLPEWLSDHLLRLGGSSGLLIVTGSFASGKSTTAAACLYDWVNSGGGVGVTLEDPPEKPLEGYHAGGPIFQIPITEEGFAAAVRASRRWAYRYFYMGEIRSGEAAEELLQVALSGPMAITTMHGAGPVEALMALSRFTGSAADPHSGNDRIAASVLGVLHQSLKAGRVQTRYLSLTGRNASAMRTKIINGQFHLLREDLEYQERLRSLGRAAESL